MLRIDNTSGNNAQNEEPSTPANADQDERLLKSDVPGSSVIGQVYRALRVDPELKPFATRMRLEGPIKISMGGQLQPEAAMVITLNVGSRTKDAFAIRKNGGVFQVLANISGSKALGEFGRRSVSKSIATRAGAQEYDTDPGRTKITAVYNKPELDIPDMGDYSPNGSFLALPEVARTVKELVALISGQMEKSLGLKAKPTAGKVPVPEASNESTMPASQVTPKIRKEIEALIKKYKLGNDIHLYSQQEWKDRGEPFGNNSPLSITFEGPLYQVINDPSSYTQKIYDKFFAIPQKYGWYWELGYAWSAHLYPRQSLKESKMTKTTIQRKRTPSGTVASIVRQVKRGPAMIPFRAYIDLGTTEVPYKGKSIPAMLLAVDKEGNRLGDFAVFKTNDAKPYKIIANIGGARALGEFGRKSVSKQKATMTAAQNLGTDPSKTKLSIKYGDGDTGLQGAAQEKGKFLSIPVDIQDAEELKKTLTGLILLVLGEKSDVLLPEAKTVYGVHVGGQFLVEDTEMEQEPGPTIPFDYYGDGEGLYVAADTLYQKEYRGTLAESMATLKKSDNASWSETVVEVIGPIPAEVQKLASPSHWKTIAATQAICREDAMDKFVEAIGKTGYGAEVRHGVIRVSNEAAEDKEESGSEILKLLDNPDNVGQSEYAAIYEALSDMASQGDLDRNLADSICDSFIEYADDIASSAKKAKSFSRFFKGLDDPDMVGASEYRAIYDIVEGADDLELVKSICDEFKSWAQEIKKKLQAKGAVNEARCKPVLDDKHLMLTAETDKGKVKLYRSYNEKQGDYTYTFVGPSGEHSICDDDSENGFQRAMAHLHGYVAYNKSNESLSVPQQHQLAIAKKTLRLSDDGAKILGGMTKEEARRFLRTKAGWSKERVERYEQDEIV